MLDIKIQNAAVASCLLAACFCWMLAFMMAIAPLLLPIQLPPHSTAYSFNCLPQSCLIQLLPPRLLALDAGSLSLQPSRGANNPLLLTVTAAASHWISIGYNLPLQHHRQASQPLHLPNTPIHRSVNQRDLNIEQETARRDYTQDLITWGRLTI